MLHNVIKISANLRNARGFLLNRSKFHPCCRLLSSKDDADSGPIKFSTSPAARRTVAPVMKRTISSMPWYQPYSIVASVAVFLLYFCVLREENDVDLEFNKTLYDRLQGLEKQQLIVAYKYNMENGKDVSDIEKRLKELEVNVEETTTTTATSD